MFVNLLPCGKSAVSCAVSRADPGPGDAPRPKDSKRLNLVDSGYAQNRMRRSTLHPATRENLEAQVFNRTWKTFCVQLRHSSYFQN